MDGDRSPRPLRLAIVHASAEPLPVWVARLIERLADDPDLRVIGVLPGASADQTPQRQIFSLVLALEGLTERSHYRGVSTARAEAYLASLPVLGADTGIGAVDLVLALTGQGLNPDQLNALGCEEWSLRIAGAPFEHAGEESMRAITDGAPSVPITLMSRTSAAPDGRAVFSAHYNIKPSAVALKVFLGEKAVVFLQRALRCRACGRPVDSGVAANPDAPPPASRSARSYPAALSRAILQRAAGRVRDKIGRPCDHWELKIGKGAPGQPDLDSLRPLPRFHRAMADPFLFGHQGALYLFYEAYQTPRSNAWIEVCRLDGDRTEPLGAALRCPYHLSFPQVFAHDGEIYMMPETQQTNRLEIWRATNFPLEWELHAVALEGMLPADSSLFQHGDDWWLFSNLSDHHRFQEHSSALYLFRVDGPALTSIRPHRLNPVVIGSDVSRNAGSVVDTGKMIIRPSQNNSYGIYGYGVNLMRVDRLDDQDYRETLIRRITPRELGDVQGVHHLAFAEGRFVLDAYLNRTDSLT